MTPERWKKIEELFQKALDLPEAERRAFLAEACAGDESLCAEVLKLTAQHDEAGDFIENPAFAATGFEPPPHSDTPTAPMTGPFEDPSVGKRIGNYQIAHEIGRGGMGAVYLAERADSEFRRRVAIKLIKRGMDTDFILRRFRNERQILATLDHPNIAKLLDGGTTEDGLPYFVMEYIEGLPLYRYCDEKQLTVPERLRLFCQVCEAVHYAHRNLVIHRDIKPSNILVTPSGAPKLLDFGIAKVLNPEMVADISLDPTATAMRLMTPEYASPEQVQGQAITPATDVYSLGVLLYELLTGHRPYRFRNRSPHEVARVICEESPASPSVVITYPDDLLPAHAPGEETRTLEYLYWSRGSTVETLRGELQGDLDNIVMKALSKEPPRRYQSVADLREDIVRYLDGRPVSALPFRPSAPQPAARFIPEAHTGEKSIAVLPLKIIDARRGTDSGDDYLGIGLADALIARLSNVHRFVVRPTSSVLRYGASDTDPVTIGRELGVDYVVDGTIRRAGEHIRISAQLLSVWEGATRWAGMFDEKSTDVLQLEDSISEQITRVLVPHLTGDEHRQLHKRGTDNAEAYEAYLRGRYHWNTFTEEGFAKALVSYNRAIALDPQYALAYTGVADYYNFLGVYGVMPFRECSAAAKEAALKAVALDDTLGEAYSALGFAVLTYDFDWKSAEEHHRRAIELNTNYATAHQWYSFHLQMEGRFDEALVEARKAWDLDPSSSSILQGLGWCYYQGRRFDEALIAYRNLLEATPNFAYGHSTHSIVLRHMGRYEEAVSEALKGVEFSSGGPFFLSFLAGAYAAAGREDEAREVLARLEEMSQQRYVSPYHLALIHVRLGEKERALDLLEEAYRVNEGWLTWLGVEPEMDPLRTEPRFQELLRRTRNPATLRGAGRPGAQGQSAQAAQDNGNRPAAGAPPINQRPTEDEEAHKLYVAGRYFATRRTAEGLKQAIERLGRAVERDPRFALAYSEMADCYALLNWYVEPPPDDAWDCAKRAALMAVEADDQLAEAHASLGFVKLYYDRDGAGAERELRRAIELNPDNAVARRWHAFNLSAMGRHDEAIVEIRRAQEISPRSPVAATAVANVLFFAQRFEEAVKQCRRALELDPGSLSTHIVLRWSYEMLGICDEALAVNEQERAFAGDTASTMAKRAEVLAACGHAPEARAILEELIAGREEQWVTAYEIAVVYTFAGDVDEAFKWLESAERENAVGLTYLRVDPRLNPLRDDPRLERLVKRMSRTGDEPEGDILGQPVCET